MDLSDLLAVHQLLSRCRPIAATPIERPMTTVDYEYIVYNSLLVGFAINMAKM